MAVKQKYRDIVKNATIAAGIIGAPGAFSFGLDATAMSATWVSMIVAIAKESGQEIDTIYATKLAAGVLAGVGAYVGGSKLATQAFHLIPGAGTLAVVGINSTFNALFTYKLGDAISNLFDKDGFDISDVDHAKKVLLEQ